MKDSKISLGQGWSIKMKLRRPTQVIQGIEHRAGHRIGHECASITQRKQHNSGNSRNCRIIGAGSNKVNREEESLN